MKRTLAVIVVCGALGWFLGEPIRRAAHSFMARKAAPRSILPANRLPPQKPWLDAVNERFASWERPLDVESCRRVHGELSEWAPPVRACALARLTVEWHALDPEDLWRFVGNREASDDLMKTLLLQLAYHHAPEQALPWLGGLAVDTTSMVEAFLLKAAEGDSDRMRDLIVEHRLADSNDAPLVQFAQAEMAVTKALSEGRGLAEALLAWGKRDPVAAWEAAIEHDADVITLEGLFREWCQHSPESAFVRVTEIADALSGQIDEKGLYHALGRGHAEMDLMSALKEALTTDFPRAADWLAGCVSAGVFPGVPVVTALLEMAPPEMAPPLLRWIAHHVTEGEALALVPEAYHESLLAIYEGRNLKQAVAQASAVRAKALWDEIGDHEEFRASFAEWVREDSAGARTWAAEQQSPGLFDQWRMAQVSALTKSPGGAPQSIVELATMISDPVLKAGALEEALAHWVRVNPKQAVGFMATAPIDGMARDRLIAQADETLTLLRVLEAARALAF